MAILAGPSLIGTGKISLRVIRRSYRK